MWNITLPNVISFCGILNVYKHLYKPSWCESSLMHIAMPASTYPVVYPYVAHSMAWKCPQAGMQGGINTQFWPFSMSSSTNFIPPLTFVNLNSLN